MRNTNNNFMISLYIISLTFAFTTRYGDYRIGFELQMLIGAFWIIIALLNFLINGRTFKSKLGSDFKWLIKLYLTPHIVIHLYTIILMIVGKVDWNYFTSNVTVYIPTLLSIVSIYLFGTKAFEYTFIALIASWLLSVISSMLMKGPAIFLHAILQAYINPNDTTGGLIVNYLELHDLVLAIGYILVFYVFSSSKLLTKKKFITLTSTLLVIGLGMKRVTLVALVLVLIFHALTRTLSDYKRYKLCLLAGWFAFIVCYLFIFVLSKGNEFYDFVANHGINVMGRNYYYQAIMRYAEFRPTFIGIGRNVVTRILNNELSYLKVGGVHSDIIKMYVENGFIMFGLWLWYYLIYVTKQYRKRYGNSEAILYFSLVIYTFTLYLTDNIEVYFICQIFSILIPATYALERKRQDYYLKE